MVHKKELPKDAGNSNEDNEEECDEVFLEEEDIVGNVPHREPRRRRTPRRIRTMQLRVGDLEEGVAASTNKKGLQRKLTARVGVADVLKTKTSIQY